VSTVFTEEIWITLVIFMFLVVIGYLKKDAIIHLISVVIGIGMMLEFLGTNLYLGFAMAVVSIYLAYYALLVEWNEGD
jgi:hypothetical protein